MEKMKNIGIGLLWIILTAACTERIELELDQTFTRLVVDGGISNEPAHHMVRLTTSTGYFFNQEPPAVRGAIVHLVHGDKRILFSELTASGGYYALPALFKAKPGETYQLDIKLSRGVGGASQYSATAEMPTTEFQLDSIQMEYNERFDFWLVKVYALDPPSRDFYKFETFLNSIAGNDTTMRTTATPDRFFNGRNTNGFSVAFFDGELLAAGDTITLAMLAITEDYFNFYSELRSESGFSNPLFAGPPANIRSNIEEGGLGYFSARKVARTRVIVPDWRKK